MRVVVEEIESLVSRAGGHPIWGYVHCLRVHALAEMLEREERIDYDPEILRLSALLHDIGLYRAYSLRESADHVRRSVAVATRLLRDGNFPSQAARVVLDAIEHHPPGAPPGRSTELPSSRTPSPSTTSALSTSRGYSAWSVSKTTSRTSWRRRATP